MSDPCRTVWPAGEIAALGFDYAHPLDERARTRIVSLSRLAGLARAGLNLVRVAPGDRAFPFHRHHREEEWVYVLEGAATVRLGSDAHALGPGGFVAFPPGGPAHCVENRGTGDLVCLTGGESAPVEIVDFPDLGRRVLRGADGARETGLEDEAFDFFARTPLPGRAP